MKKVNSNANQKEIEMSSKKISKKNTINKLKEQIDSISYGSGSMSSQKSHKENKQVKKFSEDKNFDNNGLSKKKTLKKTNTMKKVSSKTYKDADDINEDFNDNINQNYDSNDFRRLTKREKIV